ncbi:hypothetical protein VC83_01388 [Pseudogymnoascus destructans]|uniref:Uncharacterized protein n=1 Tax=Pseudogymnoascus destructans TaxID=655981 RepID=A0A177AJP4_9PEZI|nr:uncharacterized protein VC83_01388 [Pseudogymnoascus destructans]OAF61732.1 hypothetical protein VC83_01388 [Pseudogymnoascus destructans]
MLPIPMNHGRKIVRNDNDLTMASPTPTCGNLTISIPDPVAVAPHQTLQYAITEIESLKERITVQQTHIEALQKQLKDAQSNTMNQIVEFIKWLFEILLTPTNMRQLTSDLAHTILNLLHRRHCIRCLQRRGF